MIWNRIAVKAAFFINGFIYANWVSRLPRIQEIYSANDGEIGIVLLASSMGAITAMPFTGWAIIRNGSRRLTLLVAILYALLVPILPYMPGLTALTFLFLFMGIITGMLDVAMNSQAVMVEKRYGKPIMTSFHALFSIGMAAGGFSGAYFAELNTDLSYHFTIISIFAGVVIVFLLGPFLIQDKPADAPADGPLFRLPNASLISIGIITLCCMLGEGAMSNWSVNYLENVVKAPVAMAPLALSAFAIAMTFGRLVGDYARQKLGDANLIVLGGCLALTGLSAALLFPLTYVVLGGFFLVGSGLSTIVPISYSIAGHAKGLPSGVGLAMVTTVGYSGFFIGPPVIGFISNWLGLRSGLFFVDLLILTMVLLGIRYARNTK